MFNFKDEFREKVMQDFIDSYLNGHTPNPCIRCNRFIKFSKMLLRAETLGYDYIATGHYAINEYNGQTGRYELKRPADRSKDQTYVLYNLTQEQLSKTLFPLGNYTKPQIRQIAEDEGLVNSRKPDSQDICFVPDGNYARFIEKHATVEKGNFIDTHGNILGQHNGIINYTVGQRKGLGITFGKPVCVVSKNAENNSVTLGEASDLMRTELIAEDVNLISVPEIKEPLRIKAKTRYNQQEQPATVYPMEDNRIKIVFDEPQRAITSGQAVVMYDNDIVVGGGTII